MYKIVNPEGRIYYTETKSQPIIFEGVQAYIIFVKDITARYLQSYEFEMMSQVDHLSGLPNRRAMDHDFENIISSGIQKEKVVIAMLDLDHFKKVNDRYGHDIGDQVIQILGEVFKKRLRNTDTFYRYGGEEFVTLLRNIDLDDSVKLIQSINDSFKDAVEKRLGFKCTFSCGVVPLNNFGGDCTVAEIIKEADKLLYHAKNSGRNRVVSSLND